MNTLHIITRDGLDATATLETGKHGGPVLVIRRPAGSPVMGLKVEHVTPAILRTVLDAGTASTVLDFVRSGE